MPFTKIREAKGKDGCLNPEHNPPMHIVLEPGTYEYQCPECGKTKVIDVPLITCKDRNHEH